MEKNLWFNKLIASVLTCAMVFSTIPAVLAYADYDKEDTANASNDSETAEILYEETELRDRYTKTYKLSNANSYAFTSVEALHYETEDGWQDIDNTLTAEKSENGGDVYTNKENDFDVTIPQGLSDEPVSVREGSNIVSFKLLNDIKRSFFHIQR